MNERFYKKRSLSPFLSLILLALFVFGTPWLDGGEICAQSKRIYPPTQEFRKDPFSLPSGVRPLSSEAIPQEDKRSQPIPEIKPSEMKPAEIKPVEVPLNLKAILIGDRVRLASIDRSIVSIGDVINGEKVLEIHPDRVILEREGKKRTLVLDQSPLKITVEGK